jgi:beta-lactamase class C
MGPADAVDEWNREVEGMKSRVAGFAMAALFSTCTPNALTHAADRTHDSVKRVVDDAILPVMKRCGVPGMAVGLIVSGRPYVFDYGVASVETRRPVGQNTLFELGSISKTFTATLASYAQVSGHLSFSDRPSKYLPSLRGSKFDAVSLLNLGTHTPGGMPLQVPENIKSIDQLMKYFADWQPSFEPGTYRTYANPSIGLLGLIAAKSMHQDFTALMEERLFPALGMTSTYINVPKAKMANYAQGYTQEDAPIRMANAVLSSEAYGVKSTATDIIRFMAANMNSVRLNAKLQRAITGTHTGYFKVGDMTQDLIWEQYSYPVDLKTLLTGNSAAVIFDATPVTPITPPQEPREDVLINKTGTTNGFGAYVAFVPEKQMGIVILANKNYPIDERVTIAHRIMARLVGNVGVPN